MIIPDNVTVYMNGRAYYAHVCDFYLNDERLSLSIDASCLKRGGDEANRADPPRREISVTANVNGKSVIITHDPHDPEATKAADVWRKALFAEPPKDAPTPAFERIRREGYCLRQPAAETVKNGEPATPEIIANPGNYGVIGFWWEDWADGSYFLRWRTEPGADAMKVVRLTGKPDCGFRIEIPSDGAEDVATPENGIPWEPRFFEAQSRAYAMRKIEAEIRGRIKADDVRRLTWIRVKEPPKVDLRQLDREICELSGIVKDDRKGWDAYFDSVNITHVVEWLKQFREMMNDTPTAMTELEKAAKPLRDYLKAHGDPHTSVIVTQDGATEAQDERRVKFDGGTI